MAGSDKVSSVNQRWLSDTNNLQRSVDYSKRERAGEVGALEQAGSDQDEADRGAGSGEGPSPVVSGLMEPAGFCSDTRGYVCITLTLLKVEYHSSRSLAVLAGYKAQNAAMALVKSAEARWGKR